MSPRATLNVHEYGGGDGNDRINYGAGNDFLFGQGGYDLLVGVGGRPGAIPRYYTRAESRSV
jgi:Ca2+-binding RTX toxin-like protein